MSVPLSEGYFDTNPAGTGLVGLDGAEITLKAGKSILIETFNTIIGTGAAPSLVPEQFDRESASGAQNTAVGDGALAAIVTSAENTAIGSRALASLTDLGAYNTAIGAEAMQGNTSGTCNVAVGVDALMQGSECSDCVAVGFDALVQNTADNNTAVGYSALFNNIAGIRNVALGWNAGYPGGIPANANSGNTDCTFIGYNTGAKVGSQLLNATAIGSSATVGASNAIQLGNANVTDVTFGGAGTVKLGSAALPLKGVHIDYTNTATIGAVTINKSSGRCNIATDQTSVTVTNSLVTAASHVFAQCAGNDATAMVKSVVAAAGSFVINLSAAATTNVAVNFLVVGAD
jgi:hypothetical protein